MSKWITYDPTVELLQESVKVTRRMQAMSMPTSTHVPVKRIAPPGRLMGRMAVHAAGMRAAGNPIAARRVPMFKGVHTDRSTAPPAVVGIMADVSGSMSWSTTGVGEAAWLLARGAAHAGARVASVVFGEGVDPVVFPGDVPQKIVVRSAVDPTESADVALAALDGGLGLSMATFSGAPVSRVVIVISDMMWTGEQRHRFAVRARALAVTGVRFMVLGLNDAIGSTPSVRLPPEIGDLLGVHIPTPRGIRDPQHPRFKQSPSGLRNWYAANTGDLPGQTPRGMTAAEKHASGGAITTLPPMIAIPRVMLGNYATSEYESYRNQRQMFGASRIRDQIVGHTLDALDGME